MFSTADEHSQGGGIFGWRAFGWGFHPIQRALNSSRPSFKTALDGQMRLLGWGISARWR